jgi:hypothetical protein
MQSHLHFKSSFRFRRNLFAEESWTIRIAKMAAYREFSATIGADLARCGRIGDPAVQGFRLAQCAPCLAVSGNESKDPSKSQNKDT